MPEFDEDGLPKVDGSSSLPALNPGVGYDVRHYTDNPSENFDSRQYAANTAAGKTFADVGVSGSTQTPSAQSVGGIAGFSISTATTKISEAASQLVGSLGSIGNFSKIGANLPSFDTIKASALRAGGTLLGSQSAVASNLLSKNASKLAGTGTASQVKRMAAPTALSTDHLVTLTEVGYRDPQTNKPNVVTFDVLPQITEAHSVEYEQIAPSQFVGAFMKFKGVAPVQWTISATFVSRTPDEAEKNYGYLNLLRGWKEPFWGANTGRQFPGKLGGPPPVLRFKGLRGVIGEVPVVLTSLNWAWPKDVDYIPMSKSVGEDKNPLPFPAVINIDLQAIESYSTGEMNSFSLNDYRSGKMKAAFGGASNLIVQANGSGEGGAGGTASVDTSNYSSDGRSSASTVNGSTPDVQGAPALSAKQQEIDKYQSEISAAVKSTYDNDALIAKMNGVISSGSATPAQIAAANQAIASATSSTDSYNTFIAAKKRLINIVGS